MDARVRAQLEEMPEITAEGCTVQKTTKPEQSQVTRNGEEYVMVTYKSAVTAAKAGKLRLGPVTVQAEAQLPQRRPRRSGGPFDDPFFQNPFFDDAFQHDEPAAADHASGRSRWTLTVAAAAGGRGSRGALRERWGILR